MYYFYSRNVVPPSGGAMKILQIMKLTTVLLVAVVMQVSAGSYAQKISLSEKNASIQNVFDRIRAQSGYDFLFSTAVLKNAKPVSVLVKDSELKEVLDKVFDGQPLEYSIIRKSVIVSIKETNVLDRMLNYFSAIDIKGQVLDENGRPVNRANIKVKSTGKVAITDDFGRFTISVPNEEAILIVSYVGYATKEVPVKSSMIIILNLNQNKLDEMVVVGYGSTKRKDLTGSVASIDINEIKNVPFATIDQALTGKAAGVQVIQADGSPGGVAKIRIRGGTSLLGGNDPLYIIDGVQMQVQNRYIQSAAEVVNPVDGFGLDGGSSAISGSFARGSNSLGGLNINDIESIDILKDASATAIYGSRAANGVVIITTKKGRFNQKPTLDVNYYVGQSTAVKEKLLDRDQYIMILKEAAKNLNEVRAAYTPPRAPTALANNILNNPNYFGTASTDWLDLVLRKSVTQNADISLRGGGAGSRYYTSVSYNKSNGVVKGTDYNRLAGKLSLDNEINSKLRFNTNLDYGYTTNNITNGIYTQALFAPPTIAPYNADGSIKVITSTDNGDFGYEGFQNPMGLLTAVNRANSFTLIGSLAGEYDILKELKFRSSVSVNYNNYRQTNYQPSTALTAAGSFGTQLLRGIGTESQSQESNIFYENTLTWNKEFNENHRLNVLVGTSWQISKSSSFSASGQGFPDDLYLNNLSSAATTLPSTGLSAQNSLLSFYARANYTMFDKYIFTFTGRSDASSKFPEKNRVGYFPSGGVAWRISQENFLKDVKWIDEIKIRASAGRTGTQNIGDNLFYTLYSPVSYAGTNGLVPSQLGNDQIKWESTLQKDLGVQFQFFKSRIRGEFGYYEKSTSGILFPATVASSSGFKGVTANLADINNRGLELQIGGDFIRKKDWQWSGTLNISGNRSKVMALSNDFADPTNPKTYTYGSTVLKVGEPVGLFYGYINDGLIRTQQELDAYKASFPTWMNYFTYLGIGDTKYIIDPKTKFMKSTVIGHAEPKYYGGYTNSLTYKNFTLTALATFSYGGQISYQADIQNADVSQRTNKGVRILERWTPENTESDRPRLILGQGYSYGVASSRNIYDASFIRLKSITLNYQFPKTLLNKLKINQAAVYMSATNLFTITNYPGADPEVSNNPYSLIGGYNDSAGYPTVKQLSFGVRLGF